MFKFISQHFRFIKKKFLVLHCKCQTSVAKCFMVYVDSPNVKYKSKLINGYRKKATLRITTYLLPHLFHSFVSFIQGRKLD